jgi:hypothetical protein
MRKQIAFKKESQILPKGIENSKNDEHENFHKSPPGFGMDFAYIFDFMRKNDNSMLVSRDKDKHNRYWFDFPREWRTSNYEERTIGFRSLYIATSLRHVMFTLMIDYRDITTSHTIRLILYYNDTLITLVDKIREQLGDDKDLVEIFSISSSIPKPENVIYSGANWIAYDLTSNEDIRLSENDSEETRPTVLVFAAAKENTKIRITEMTGDTNRALFNAADYEINGPQTEFYHMLVFYNLWDRKSCCLKSSLVGSVADNYLGYTNVRYNPLRYFHITNNDTRFYIDLYNGHLPHFQSILPYDDLDAITLELVVY